MKALSKIIGPAPSERDPLSLQGLIRKEHQRVSRSIFQPPKKGKKAPSLSIKVKKMEEKYGSLEELERKLRAVERFEKEKEKGGKS